MNKKTIILTIVGAGFILPSSSLAVWRATQAKPQPSAFISPLAETVKPTPLPPNKAIYSLDYYLSLANLFLQKATRLANDNPSQTDQDKQNIITHINEALKAANEAVTYYPNEPQAYLTRSQIYAKIKHLDAKAAEKEQSDLEIAKRLINKTDLTNTNYNKSDQPLDFVPNQKASIASNIIIAEPLERKSEIQNPKSEIETNALSGESVIFAGETEVLIPCPQLTEKDMVYVLAKNNPDKELIYVKSRQNGEWFKMGLDKPAINDLGFKWWVIN